MPYARSRLDGRPQVVARVEHGWEVARRAGVQAAGREERGVLHEQAAGRGAARRPRGTRGSQDARRPTSICTRVARAGLRPLSPPAHLRARRERSEACRWWWSTMCMRNSCSCLQEVHTGEERGEVSVHLPIAVPCCGRNTTRSRPPHAHGQRLPRLQQPLDGGDKLQACMWWGVSAPAEPPQQARREHVAACPRLSSARAALFASCCRRLQHCGLLPPLDSQMGTAAAAPTCCSSSSSTPCCVRRLEPPGRALMARVRAAAATMGAGGRPAVTRPASEAALMTADCAQSS